MTRKREIEINKSPNVYSIFRIDKNMCLDNILDVVVVISYCRMWFLVLYSLIELTLNYTIIITQHHQNVNVGIHIRIV